MNQYEVWIGYLGRAEQTLIDPGATQSVAMKLGAAFGVLSTEGLRVA